MTPPGQIDPQPAIQATSITKRYKGHRGSPPVEALRGVTLTITKGGIHGILGPNGAGKTTLLSMLTTVSRPDSGDILVDGINALKKPLEVRNHIGIVAQGSYLDRYLNIWQNLRLHGQLHGMAKASYEARITELLQQFGLYHRRFAMPDELSGGMKRRVVLLRALIHHPAILFLDEPSTGLDPKARRDIWEIVEALRHVATVILTTHYMEEADYLCDTLTVMDQGLVVETGTPRELKARLAPTDTYELTLTEPRAAALADTLRTMPTEQLGIEVKDDYRLILTTADFNDLIRHVQSTVPAGAFEQLGKVRPGLESVYLALAGGQDDEAPEAEAS